MLKIKGLSFSYGKNEVLKDVSFELDRGIKALVAPNGAGKTTLFQCVAQQLTAKGEIYIDDEEMNHRGILEYLTFLGDYTLLDPEITAKDYLEYIAKIYDISKDKIEEIAEKTDISYFYENKIGTYSLGMKSRTMIAMSVLPDTEYIFLDEPLSGLDPGSVNQMKDLLLELGEDKGIILSSHILDDINDLTEETFFLKDGEIIRYESNLWQSLKIKTKEDEKARFLLDDKNMLLSDNDIIIDKKDLNETMILLVENKIPVDNILSLRDSLKNKYFELYG